MRFDDSIEEDDPIPKKSIVPSPDRTSRTIRVKLLMLFAMLIAVMVLMKEAGKPERWEWMGFEKPNTIKIEGDVWNSESGSIPADSGQAIVESQPNKPNRSATSAADTSVQSSGPITISVNQFGPTGETSATQPVVRFDVPGIQPDYPVAAAAFWNSTFRRLNSDQQTILLRLLKNMRHGQVLAADQQPSAQQIVRWLQSHREQFHQTLFDELALTADGTPEKTRLANEMYESQEIWEKKIAPAMEAASHGDDFTMAQSQAVWRLQRVLDPLLYQQVQDRTSLGWKGDSAAWIRIWEKVTSDELPTYKPVSRIELMGQPKVYRGEPVTVGGWVRLARKKTLGPESELGLSHYYILWVRPQETTLGPFCIYTMTLPEGFPTVTETFSEVNENVRVNGYSFKVRNYIADGSSVSECPVIISRGLAEVKTPEFSSVNRWQPSRSTLTITFILIPLLAIGMAWLAFRNSKTRRYMPSKNSRQKIDQSLSSLANDPRVQTEREKVMSLYESETHDQ